jgi:aspartate kinase
MKVLKFGGSCLKDSKGFIDVARIIKNENERRVIILSGVCGVTDTIQKYLNYKIIDEIAISGLIKHLKRLHYKIASEAITDIAILKKVQAILEIKLQNLEQLLRGVYYVKELTDRTRDLILSYGERLSVPILAGTLNDRGIKAKAFEADNLGILTNGDYGNAIAILNPISKKLKKNILPLFDKKIIPIITGFFGCDNNGETTIFGRNGSDYSASVIAYSLDADRVDLWKDVDGFMSADPKIIDDSYLLNNLTYKEAAELSYFGAKIIHPRTVEPLMKKNIKLHIKNVNNPNFQGTNICDNGHKNKNIIKSIAYSKDISCIKIHGSGVGQKPGVLLEIVSKISSQNINIISVVTSQTCITLLLESKDLKSSYNILSSKQIKTVEKIEKIKDIALIAVVGEGLLKHYGIAAKVSNAVANIGINIEMISAGASEVAYYFIVKENVLEQAIKAIHKDLSIPVFSKIN